MQIEIVSIGNEVLLGATVNTNAAWIARELSYAGLSCHRMRVIPDERLAIRKEIEDALNRSDLVIATGGLGPTIDDLTLSSVEGIFFKPESMLKNEIGTAPGIFYFSKGKGLILLPGVPKEMEKMFSEYVLSLIQKFFSPPKEYISTFSICLFKEKEIDPYLLDLKKEHPEIESGIYPARGTLQIVFRSKKPIDAITRRFEEKFPTYVFPEKKIEEALHREMIARKKTLALAESCTGGAIAAKIAAIPDASYFLLGSIVAYSNEWKKKFLNVDLNTIESEGAVSAETVAEMIEGLFTQTKADYAIAVSGIAGPSGGSKEKPVGTIFIGIGKRGERSDIGLIHAPNDRMSAIELAVQTALSVLWRRLVHNTTTFS